MNCSNATMQMDGFDQAQEDLAGLLVVFVHDLIPAGHCVGLTFLSKYQPLLQGVLELFEHL